MNLKHIFLAATAALMLPGFAMAQGITITFDTQIASTNLTNVDALATLTCNTGVPLVQSLEITRDQGVVFVVNNFEGSAAIGCSVTIDGTDAGYAVSGVIANTRNLTAAGSCNYTETFVPGESAAGEVDNTCLFTIAPEPFVWTIKKVWDIPSDTDVSEFASFDWKCTNILTSANDITLGNIEHDFDLYGDDSESITLWPNTLPFGDPSVCRATENPGDSAVESDQGCEGGTVFPVGRATGDCTVTNTVFFEGIPTLSQYGLAIMALLMLGVGFVGFRRFV